MTIAARFTHLAPLAAIEPDREWFADHGRRKFRWRPAGPDEDGDSVIVRRQAGGITVLPIALAPHPGLQAADDWTLGVLFDAFATVAKRKKAAERQPDGL